MRIIVIAIVMCCGALGCQSKNDLGGDRRCSDRLAAVFLDIEHSARYGYINKEGETVIPFQFRSAAHFSEGLARVTLEDGRFAFITRNGNINLTLGGDVIYASDVSDGMILVNRGGQAGEIDYSFVEGGEWFYVDTIGRELAGPYQVPLTHVEEFMYFDGVFYEGRAAIPTDDGWVFIDKSGEVVIEGPFEEVVEPFCDGMARVLVRGESGTAVPAVIGRNGQELWRPYP